MSQRNLRLISILGNSITFADPLNVGNTTRFDQATSNVKSPIGLIPFQRSEMISNRLLCVKPVNCVDAVATNMMSSVRVKIQSPLVSSVEVKQQVLDALENVRIAVENGLLGGIKPSPETVLVADFEVV